MVNRSIFDLEDIDDIGDRAEKIALIYGKLIDQKRDAERGLMITVNMAILYFLDYRNDPKVRKYLEPIVLKGGCHQPFSPADRYRRDLS